MAVEQLIRMDTVIKKPFFAFYIGLLASTLGVLLSMRVLQMFSSILLIVFAIIPLIPLLTGVMMRDERISEHNLHDHIWSHPFLKVYSYLFLGLVFGYTLWFTLLPTLVGQDLFYSQIAVLNGEPVQNSFTAVSYGWHIFVNNMQFLIFVFFLSFLFGAGAIFILTWNASILGVFFGESLHRFFGATPLLPINLFTIWIHGLPEFFAYFIAAVSGGVFGVVLFKRRFGSPLFQKVVSECGRLFLLATGILIFAAFLEVLVVF